MNNPGGLKFSTVKMDFKKSTSIVDPSTLTDKSDVSKLLSMCPGSQITISKKDKPWSSLDIYSLVTRNKGTIRDVPYSVYDKGTMDKFRLTDNSDLLSGRAGVVFDDLTHFRHIHDAIGSLVKEVLPILNERASKGDMIASMELQDFKKISLQRVYDPGVRLDLHFVDGIKKDKYPEEFQKIVASVLDRYINVAGDVAKLGSARLRLLDSDPPDTSLGLFPNVSDGETHAGRIMMLKGINFGKGTPGMFDSMQQLAVRMGVPDYMGVAMKKAYRHRTVAGDKKVNVTYFNGRNYESRFEATGLLDPGRSVYQFSYAINYVLSPLYLFFKTARSRMKGMYHTADMLKDTTNSLVSEFKAGRKPYAVDQSAQDKHIGAHFFEMVCDHLIKRGVLPDEAALLRQLPRNTTTLIPHPEGPERQTLAVMGISGMPSGLKLTSEIDTLQNLCTALFMMERIEPGATKSWLAGRLIYPAQGDDGLLMIRPQDVGKIPDAVKEAQNVLGVEMKMFPDALFLKMMLPLDPRLSSSTRPLSRVIQNTLYNEDNYTGVKGGNTPDAILRLGLTSRFDNISANPFAKEMWSKVTPIIRDLTFMRRSTDSFNKNFVGMKAQLEARDMELILLYTKQVPNYAERLVERSSYDPGAQKMLDFLRKNGIDLSAEVPSNSNIRRAYEEALQSPPSDQAIRSIVSSTNWIK